MITFWRRISVKLQGFAMVVRFVILKSTENAGILIVCFEIKYMPNIINFLFLGEVLFKIIFFDTTFWVNTVVQKR